MSRNMCIHYNEVLLLRARDGGCNASHGVAERSCRWPLQSADRARQSDTVALTELRFPAETLAVFERTSRHLSCRSKIQVTGEINYSRGTLRS